MDMAVSRLFGPVAPISVPPPGVPPGDPQGTLGDPPGIPSPRDPPRGGAQRSGPRAQTNEKPPYPQNGPKSDEKKKKERLANHID